MTTSPALSPFEASSPAASLRGLCGGAVHLPGDPGYDAARSAWNTAVEQRPAAVAYPATAAEVRDVVRAAARAGLRVAPQSTGHHAAALHSLADAVLLRTAAMRGIEVRGRTARVEAGVFWQDAVEAAAEHGLAALHGSSPDVGVIGYSLGGGIGWYARALGLASSSVTAVELVTADGEHVRADATHEPDLFWALRGGGGGFGVVTALEFALYDVATPVAGALTWDVARAPEVLRRWVAWAAEAPDAVTTALRVHRVPPLAGVPVPLHGRTLVVVDGAVLGGEDAADRLLAPLRALRPETDTFAPVAPVSLTRLHGDPDGPSASTTRCALVDDLPDPACDALVAAFEPGSGSDVLVAEARQLGGALRRPQPGGGALDRLDAAFAVLAVAPAPTPEARASGGRDAQRLLDAVAPWGHGAHCLSLTEQPVAVASGFAPERYARLCAIRADVDPTGRLVAPHSVPHDTVPHDTVPHDTVLPGPR